MAKRMNDPLSLALVLATFLILTQTATVFSESKKDLPALGGPVNNNTETALSSSEGALFSKSNIGQGELTEGKRNVGYVLINKTEAFPGDNPLKPILSQGDNLMTYEAQKGDTITNIANKFGISEDTLAFANNKNGEIKLTAGEKIIVLPVSGAVHKVEAGETVESIARKYGVDAEKIRSINSVIEEGVNIVVPDAAPEETYTRPTSYKPNLAGYFIMPTNGFNWGILHNYNAVDIANGCGMSIVAAADGVVEEAEEGGWNGGYGDYVKIEHLNGTKTLYAHNSGNEVSVGDIVKQGETIGYVGKTGNVSGPTGCHIHFEVYGAINPFAK